MSKVAANSDLTASIDWLEFTLLKIDLASVIKQFLQLPEAEFTALDKGRFGYRKQQKWQQGNVFVLYNATDGSDEMGIHVMLTGTGCRDYEAHHDLRRLLLCVVAMDTEANFSRLDLAIDDIGEHLLNFGRIHDAALARHFTSRWAKWDEVNSRKCNSGEYLGRTMYFGSQSSDIFCRIYDKTLERQAKGDEDEPVPEHWTRWEVVYRKDRAANLARVMATKEMAVGEAIRATLNQYLRFLTPSADTNKSRWPTAPWWERFLADVGKLVLTSRKETKSIEEMADWVNRQIGPTIAAIMKAKEGEMDWLVRIINGGVGRLSQRHLDAIFQYQTEQEKSDCNENKAV